MRCILWKMVLRHSRNLETFFGLTNTQAVPNCKELRREEEKKGECARRKKEIINSLCRL